MQKLYTSFAALALLLATHHCAALPLASQSRFDLFAYPQANETPCEACVKLVAILKAYVSSPTTQQRILNFVLEELCPKLPVDDRQYCSIYSPIAIAAATGWIEGREATEVCGQVQLCPAQAGLSLVPGGNEPAQQYVATVLQSVTTLPSVKEMLIAATRQRVPVPNDDCDTCKIAIVEVAAILADPGTQKELLDYAKEACDTFPDFHDQCLTYVEMYGPLLLNAAVAYMTPDVCIRLGLCVIA